MKYLIILGDGMADYPVEELGGATPLDKAVKPHMDYLASHGICGLVRTVPEGVSPASDTANLSVLGYDPRIYYSGRSSLEAVSLGIELEVNDVTYRCNTVTLSDEENINDCVMVDHGCDDISTEESTILINELNQLFKNDNLNLYPGFSYRHCLVLKDSSTGANLTPPHDILGKPIKDCLPKGENGRILEQMIRLSYQYLRHHPINEARRERGLHIASAIWFWGEGRKPALPCFAEKFGCRGAMISAVDLMKGIGKCAGLDVIEVEGATGTINTNFKGKAEAALNALRNGCDFAYIHVEAPDECGHRHEIDNKVKSIGLIDQHIVGPLITALKEDGEDFAILLLPDHPTPIRLRTHTSDPVPFALYRSNDEQDGQVAEYNEKSAASTGVYVAEGHTLIDLLMQK